MVTRPQEKAKIKGDFYYREKEIYENTEHKKPTDERVEQCQSTREELSFGFLGPGAQGGEWTGC